MDVGDAPFATLLADHGARHVSSCPTVVTDADVAPDGQSFAMVRVHEDGPQQLRVIVNWFAELTRLVPTEP